MSKCLKKFNNRQVVENVGVQYFERENAGNQSVDSQNVEKWKFGN